MEALLILPLAGLVLPARYALRLGALGIVALMGWAVYDPVQYQAGAGDALGMAVLSIYALTFFGAILLGLVLRGVWHSWHGTATKAGDFSAPLLDWLLVSCAMLVPAGIAALAMGQALSGDPAPLRTHLVLLAGLALTTLLALALARGLIRAGLLGFAAFSALIVVDSMRLDHQLRAALPQDAPFCLTIGPDRLTLSQVPPLMGLTAPKPILLHIAEPDGPRLLRWSFRWHGFVRGGINPEDVPCTPALP